MALGAQTSTMIPTPTWELPQPRQVVPMKQAPTYTQPGSDLAMIARSDPGIGSLLTQNVNVQPGVPVNEGRTAPAAVRPHANFGFKPDTAFQAAYWGTPIMDIPRIPGENQLIGDREMKALRDVGLANMLSRADPLSAALQQQAMGATSAFAPWEIEDSANAIGGIAVQGASDSDVARMMALSTRQRQLDAVSRLGGLGNMWDSIGGQNVADIYGSALGGRDLAAEARGAGVGDAFNLSSLGGRLSSLEGAAQRLPMVGAEGRGLELQSRAAGAHPLGQLAELGGQWGRIASGQDSVARLAAEAQRDRSMRDIASLAAGGSGPGVTREALYAMGDTSQQIAGQSALAQAQERQQALTGLGSVLGQRLGALQQQRAQDADLMDRDAGLAAQSLGLRQQALGASAGVFAQRLAANQAMRGQDLALGAQDVATAQAAAAERRAAAAGMAGAVGAEAGALDSLRSQDAGAVEQALERAQALAGMQAQKAQILGSANQLRQNIIGQASGYAGGLRNDYLGDLAMLAGLPREPSKWEEGLKIAGAVAGSALPLFLL